MYKGMKTYHAVAKGEYSDYSVLAVFDDLKTAEQWRDDFNKTEDRTYDEASIEDITFITKDTKPFKVTECRLVVTLWDNGVENEFRVWTEHKNPLDLWEGIPPVRPSVRRVRAPAHNDKGGRLEIRGRSEQAVMKVYSEHVARWRALNPKILYWQE